MRVCLKLISLVNCPNFNFQKLGNYGEDLVHTHGTCSDPPTSCGESDAILYYSVMLIRTPCLHCMNKLVDQYTVYFTHVYLLRSDHALYKYCH